MVASLKRWGEFGARGQLLMKNATSLQATGKYEVTLKLSEPNGAWKNMLAYPEGGPAIYPAGIVSAAGNKPIEPKDYIGTGPYKFGEWRPNRYVELLRFDGYSKLSNARRRLCRRARGELRCDPVYPGAGRRDARQRRAGRRLRLRRVHLWRPLRFAQG